ncbi:MAG: ABC transporter permease subunit [Spirochaetota bacterium]
MNFHKKLKQSTPFLFMVLPGFIWVFILNYLPMSGLVLAFKRLRFSGNFVNSVITSKWVGLDNFRFLFGSSDAWIITRNTVLYNLGFIVLGTISALILAILLSSMFNSTLRNLYQTIFLFPNFISWVVVSYFTLAFLHPGNGLLNAWFDKLGFPAVEWYSDTGPWPYILIITNIWKGIGFGASLYLAAILNIDRSLYEAAHIDGASTMQQISNITLPFLRKLIIVLTLLAIGRIFYADFGLFYQVTQNVGLLYPVTDVIDTYVYRSLISSGDIPMATAAGFYQSLVGFVLILCANAIVRKLDRESSLF